MQSLSLYQKLSFFVDQKYLKTLLVCQFLHGTVNILRDWRFIKFKNFKLSESMHMDPEWMAYAPYYHKEINHIKMCRFKLAKRYHLSSHLVTRIVSC